MLNYIKSEFYRITHWSKLYVTAFIFLALPLIVNVILYGFTLSIPNYRYSTTSFSYSNLVSSPMIFCFAPLLLVYSLYEGNRKNGNLKNAVASGISREKIFAGQFIVSFTASLLVLVLTVTVYILSASLLLRKEGAVSVMDMLKEIAAVSLIAVAALILSIVVVQLFEGGFTGLIIWFSVLVFIPQAFFYIGRVVEPFMDIAMWLPQNFLGNMQVNQSVCEPIWNTAQGFMKCMISGFSGIIIFSIFGLFCLRKKEL